MDFFSKFCRSFAVHKIVLFIQFSWSDVSRKFCYFKIVELIIEECFRRWLTAKTQRVCLKRLLGKTNQLKFQSFRKSKVWVNRKILRTLYLYSNCGWFSLPPHFHTNILLAIYFLIYVMLQINHIKYIASRSKSFS